MNNQLWPNWYNPPKLRGVGFMERASRVTGYLPSELKGGDRTRGITRVRQAMAHVMKDGLKRSYPEIANNFGRHHSTIMHGVALSRRLETTDTNHRTLLHTLRAVL